MAHRIRAQQIAGDLDCLVPRASKFSAPRLHGVLADFLPNANRHWEEAKRSVGCVGFGFEHDRCAQQLPRPGARLFDPVEDVGELLAAPFWKGEEVGWSQYILPFACSSSRST